MTKEQSNDQEMEVLDTKMRSCFYEWKYIQKRKIPALVAEKKLWLDKGYTEHDLPGIFKSLERDIRQAEAQAVELEAEFHKLWGELGYGNQPWPEWPI